MAFTVELTNDTSVGIGESNQSTNKIGVEVWSTEAVEVRITVTVRCGRQGTDLLESTTTGVKAYYHAGAEGDADRPMSPVNAPEGDKRVWNTGSRPVPVGNRNGVSIILDNFVANTPPGRTEITIRVQTLSLDGWSSGETFTKTVEKSAPVSTVHRIHYFIVNPDYILHAGQTAVSIDFYATGYETLALFRNNEEVKVWSDDTGDEADVVGTFQDRPSITSTYRLEGTYRTPDQPDKDKRDFQYRTVQVISPGWNAIGLRQGSPVRLFVANDFSGSGTDRLYGIFKKSDGQYALYSSATGVDSWRLEEGEVPQYMAMSPGVYYDNKLWLIGGSAVDPKVVSSEVWCYEVDPSDKSKSWKKRTVAEPVPRRMGHACVVFPDNSPNGGIWVLGGFNPEESAIYKDVYQLTEDAQGAVHFHGLTQQAWGGQGRLNHAAATFAKEDGQMEVWVYGGAKTPHSGGLTDLWTTSNGIEWSEVRMGGGQSALVPDPGPPLGSALVAYPAALPQDAEAAALPDRMFLLGSFQEWPSGKGQGNVGNRISSYLFEWHSSTRVWESRPVFSGWQQFQGNYFYMQAVAFNRFLFVWSLKPSIDATLKLNILISQ